MFFKKLKNELIKNNKVNYNSLMYLIASIAGIITGILNTILSLKTLRKRKKFNYYIFFITFITVISFLMKLPYMYYGNRKLAFLSLSASFVLWFISLMIYFFILHP